MFLWLLVAFFLFSRTVHKFRHGLVTLLAIAATLLMFQTNTWYVDFRVYRNYVFDSLCLSIKEQQLIPARSLVQVPSLGWPCWRQLPH